MRPPLYSLITALLAYTLEGCGGYIRGHLKREFHRVAL
jgi:hypothetical protein